MFWIVHASNRMRCLYLRKYTLLFFYVCMLFAYCWYTVLLLTTYFAASFKFINSLTLVEQFDLQVNYINII